MKVLLVSSYFHPYVGGLEEYVKRLGQSLASCPGTTVTVLTVRWPAELEALVDRWRVVPLLLAEMPYREIHERTAVSVTTIGRVSRTLEHGAGGYRIASERMGHLSGH